MRFSASLLDFDALVNVLVLQEIASASAIMSTRGVVINYRHLSKIAASQQDST